MSTGPVERKVQASTAAATAAGLLLWILGRYVFKGDVPDVVASWVYAAVPGILAFAAGWLAKHTNRTNAEVTVSVTPGVSGKQVTDALHRAAMRGNYSTAVSDPPPSVTELQAPPAPPQK